MIDDLLSMRVLRRVGASMEEAAHAFRDFGEAYERSKADQWDRLLTERARRIAAERG